MIKIFKDFTMCAYTFGTYFSYDLIDRYVKRKGRRRKKEKRQKVKGKKEKEKSKKQRVYILVRYL